jgi:CRISPR/Cas system CSM-associated protein Csm2 small subunit
MKGSIPTTEDEKRKYEEAYQNCVQKIKVTFSNRSSDRTFVVKIGYKIRDPVQWSQLRNLLDSLRQEISLRSLESGTNVYRELLQEINRMRIELPDRINGGASSDTEELKNYFDKLKTYLGKLKPRDLESQASIIQKLTGGGEVSEKIIQQQLADVIDLVSELSEVTKLSPSQLDNISNDCKSPQAGMRQCTYTIRLYGGFPAWEIPRDRWTLIQGQSHGLIKFSVSFFDEAEEPSNGTGFLRTLKDPPEPESKSSWRIDALLGYSWDPILDPDPDDSEIDSFSQEAPYEGGKKSRIPGSTKAVLNQTLGNRADAEMVLQLKSGDFGGGDDTNDVKVSKYQVNAYGRNGLRLRFGRYDFAAPTYSIAAAESGDGWELILRNFSFGHIIKRESLTNTTEETDRDSDVYLLQGKSLSTGNLKLIRAIDFLALFGKENEENQTPYEYWTTGLEIDFATKITNHWALSGNLGAYYSERNADEETNTNSDFMIIPNGHGLAALLTLKWSHIDPNAKKDSEKLKRFLQLQVGNGSGDDPSTPDDESYLGETAGFKPDNLFIARFANVVDVRHGSSVGNGLANKSYLGLSYSEKRFSPLALISKWFNSEDRIEGESTTLRLHRYEFNEPVFDSRDAGWEVDLEFLLEVPKGVRFSLGLGKFFSGGALESVFDEDPTIVTLSTTVTLK